MVNNCCINYEAEEGDRAGDWVKIKSLSIMTSLNSNKIIIIIKGPKV